MEIDDLLIKMDDAYKFLPLLYVIEYVCIQILVRFTVKLSHIIFVCYSIWLELIQIQN